MAKWLSTLRLKDIWMGPDEGRMSIADLSKMIADRLEALRLPVECTEEEVATFSVRQHTLISVFRELGNKEDLSVWQFDALMRELYDWADQAVGSAVFNGKKLCWVETF